MFFIATAPFCILSTECKGFSFSTIYPTLIFCFFNGHPNKYKLIFHISLHFHHFLFLLLSSPPSTISFSLSYAPLLTYIILKCSPEVCGTDKYHPSSTNMKASLSKWVFKGVPHICTQSCPGDALTPMCCLSRLFFSAPTLELSLLLPALEEALLSAAIFHQCSVALCC